MSEEKKKQQKKGSPAAEGGAQQNQQGGGSGPAPAPVVVALNRCRAEGCSRKPTRTDFCEEHFEWFKFGLIAKDGHRPVDFDKKYEAFMRSKKKAA